MSCKVKYTALITVVTRNLSTIYAVRTMNYLLTFTVFKGEELVLDLNPRPHIYKATYDTILT